MTYSAAQGVPRGKQLASLFFTKVGGPESTLWVCKCGKKRAQRGSGYSNLTSHILAEHPDAVAQVQESGDPGILTFFYSKKVIDAHDWLAFVIEALQPFSVCDNPIFRTFARPSSICTKTLMKLMTGVTKLVEQRISASLPDIFALCFDGWSSGQTHYVALYATFPSSETGCGWDKVLLALSPMGDETSQNADEHIQFIDRSLEFFGKSRSNVVALIGDNCAVNTSIATKAKLYFIGCSSHRFNLAVQDHLDDYHEEIAQVRSIMVLLRNLIPAGKLRKLTPLCPRLNNVTRWSSTYDMLTRHQELRGFLADLNINALDDMLLHTREEKELDALVEQLSDLDSVTKTLQKDSTTVADVQALFEAVIEKFPEMEDRLKPNASIVLHPVFEGAVAKVLRGELTLSPAEESALKALELPSPTDVTSDVELVSGSEQPEMSLAQRALKKQRTDADKRSKYMDLRFLLPTSNMCERLFSIAGHCLTDKRQRVLPANFESQIFLYVNRNYWGIKEVAQVMKKDDE